MAVDTAQARAAESAGTPEATDRVGGQEQRSGSRGIAWLWTVGAGLLVLWSLWGVGALSPDAVNPGGLSSLARFWAAAPTPDLSGPFLVRVAEAAAVTVAFSVLGTVLASLIGVIGGVMLSGLWWGQGRSRADGASSRGTGVRRRRGRARSGRLGWWGMRAAWGLPRGVHESVWAIGLLLVLGRDPVVGILALAIPFGAITAKVVADIIDETDPAPYDALIAAGAGRLAATVHAMLPRIADDVLAYAFYRFDCALRSAVILGMIGVGGLGFELATAFQGLAYERMWTLLYALIALGWIVDRWSASLRRSGRLRDAATAGRDAGAVVHEAGRRSSEGTASDRRATGAGVERSTRREQPAVRLRPGRTRISLLVLAGLTFWSLVYLRVGIERLLSPQARERLWTRAAEALPPSLPSTWADLLGDAVTTVQISVAAIAVGSAIGVAAAFVGARDEDAGPLRRAVAALARFLLLAIRAVSPPVWALLLLFVLFPGPLPGALALGLYNAGVLGRLFGEAVETMDRRPARALQALGASRLAVFVHATIPQVTGRFTAYALYRWEVAIRESVVVGVVGAGGLGRVLESERASFDLSGMLTVVIALIVLSLLDDALSAGARRAWR